MTKHFIFAGASGRIATETAQLLRARGHRVTGISRGSDAAGYDALHTLDTYAAGHFPAIAEAAHGIAYFPGTINLKPFHRLSADDLLADLQVNSLGAAAFIQAYLGNLKQSSQGSILLMSSVAATTGMPFHSSIALAKGANEALTRALAAELAPKIRVNCIAPSLTDTPLGEKFLNTPEKREASAKRNPMQAVGTANDVAQAAAFVLDEQSSWITGQVVHVDGGMGSLKLL